MGTHPSQGYTDSEGHSRITQIKQKDMGTRIGGGYDWEDSPDLDIKGKGKNKVKAEEGIVDLAWQQLSAQQIEDGMDLKPVKEKGRSTASAPSNTKLTSSTQKNSHSASTHEYGGLAAARYNHMLQSQHLSTYSYQVRGRKDEEEWGEVKSRRWGGDRNRDHRGEILFGGVLGPKREDVERALGGFE